MVNKKIIDPYSGAILIVVMLFTCSFCAYGQIDAVKIASAQKAFENQEYQFAIDAVNEASAAAQKNKMCLYYKGYSYYKLEQYDSAAVFLKKYLLLDVTKKDVMEALVDIDYQNRKYAAYVAEIKKILGDAIPDEEAIKKLAEYGPIKFYTGRESADKFNWGDYTLTFDEYGMKLSDSVVLFHDKFYIDYLMFDDMTAVSINMLDGTLYVTDYIDNSFNGNGHVKSYTLNGGKRGDEEMGHQISIKPNPKNQEIFKLLDSICKRNIADKLILKYWGDKKQNIPASISNTVKVEKTTNPALDFWENPVKQ